MTRKQALIELRDKVTAGQFDADPGGAHLPPFTKFMSASENALPQDVRGCSVLAWECYKGSLDAALALHQAVLPNEGWRVEWIAKYPALAFVKAPFCASVGWGVTHRAYAETPARAWLLAILSALISECEE